MCLCFKGEGGEKGLDVQRPFHCPFFLDVFKQVMLRREKVSTVFFCSVQVHLLILPL